MKCLWVCNIVPNKIANNHNLSENASGGWIDSALTGLNNQEIEVYLCCFSIHINKEVRGKYNGVEYSIINPRSKYFRELFQTLIDSVEPDIMHVWGTEYAYALSVVEWFNRPERTIVHIQGVCSAIALHMLDGIPHSEINKKTFKDIVSKTSLFQLKNKMERAGSTERIILQNVNSVIGRTEFDLCCAKLMNPNVDYYVCPEVIRTEILESKKWDYSSCEKNSIFISQVGNPVKGFYTALFGLRIVKQYYPNLKVYIAGAKIEKPASLKLKLLQPYYSKLLLKQIEKLGLSDTIEFVGRLDAQEVARYLRKSNVFLLSSSCENSPNSLREAKCIGTPIVSSDIGGVKDYVEHNKTGYLYQFDAYYMMAFHIMHLFSDRSECETMSKNEISSFLQNDKISDVSETLKTIYANMINKYE